MKVLFDPQIFSIQKYGGISRYFVRMAEEMQNMGEDVAIEAGWHINYYLTESNSKLVKGHYFHKYPSHSIRAFRKLNSYKGSLRSFLSRPDIIHETYFSSEPIIKTSRSVIVTVYDMIQELYSDQFRPEELVTVPKKAALKRADHIISISHQTKKDLIRLFDIDSEKISVVHLAADKALKIDKVESEGNRPFILYVGLRSGYKNFSNFLKAFASSERLKSELNIYAFGGGGFNQQEKELIQSLGLSSNQVLQVAGTDLDLASLYSKAHAFVYPSLYEGFGIPPLEAMTYGCPVVSSYTSSLPEVIGDAGLTFDPLNVEEMASQLEKVVFDEDLRSILIEKGYQRVQQFSWKNTALQTLEIYKNVI